MLNWRTLPCTLVNLFARDILTNAGRGDADDVPCEFPDHVASRNPRRQDKTLASLIRLVDGNRDLEQVRCGVDGDDAVADHAGEPNVLAKRVRSAQFTVASASRQT